MSGCLSLAHRSHYPTLLPMPSGSCVYRAQQLSHSPPSSFCSCKDPQHAMSLLKLRRITVNDETHSELRVFTERRHHRERPRCGLLALRRLREELLDLRRQAQHTRRRRFDRVPQLACDCNTLRRRTKGRGRTQPAPWKRSERQRKKGNAAKGGDRTCCLLHTHRTCQTGACRPSSRRADRNWSLPSATTAKPEGRNACCFRRQHNKKRR